MRGTLAFQPVEGEPGVGWKISWGDPAKGYVVSVYEPAPPYVEVDVPPGTPLDEVPGPPEARLFVDEFTTFDDAVAFLADHGVVLSDAARALIGA